MIKTTNQKTGPARRSNTTDRTLLLCLSWDFQRRLRAVEHATSKAERGGRLDRPLLFAHGPGWPPTHMSKTRKRPRYPRPKKKKEAKNRARYDPTTHAPIHPLTCSPSSCPRSCSESSAARWASAPWPGTPCTPCPCRSIAPGSWCRPCAGPGRSSRPPWSWP